MGHEPEEMTGQNKTTSGDNDAHDRPPNVAPDEACASAPKDPDNAKHESRQLEAKQEGRVIGPLRKIVGWTDVHNGAITAVGTVVIAVATIVNVWYVGGQLREMQSTGTQTDSLIETNRRLVDAATEQASAAATSARTAQDSLLASQRAWVGPSMAKLEGPIEPGSKEVKAIITVSNTGREPGKNLFWDISIFTTSDVDERDGTTQDRAKAYVEACFNAPSQYRRQVLFPSTGAVIGGGFTFTTPIDHTIIDDDVVGGRKRLILQGCLAYDAFGKTRHTAFCFFYAAGHTKPDVLNICYGGTDAD